MSVGQSAGTSNAENLAIKQLITGGGVTAGALTSIVGPGHCICFSSQSRIGLPKIAQQVTNAFRLVALPPKWANWMLTEADQKAATDIQASNRKTSQNSGRDRNRRRKTRLFQKSRFEPQRVQS